MSVGLVAACQDSRLFDFSLWPRQQELLAAAESGPRVQVWALGRRSGKTTLAALVCLHDALLRPDLDAAVRSGERRYAVAVATNIAQARLLVSAARSIVERSPLLAPLVDQASEDELAFGLPSGARTALRAFPCSSRGGRGWPISCLVMDEAAHFLTETEGYQTAERVWQALVPSTAQFGEGARVIVSSTPYGQDGLFAQLHQQARLGVTHCEMCGGRHPKLNPHGYCPRCEERQAEYNDGCAKTAEIALRAALLAAKGDVNDDAIREIVEDELTGRAASKLESWGGF